MGCFLRALQLVAPPDADVQLQYVEGALVFDILAEPPLSAQQVFHHAKEQAESESFMAEVLAVQQRQRHCSSSLQADKLVQLASLHPLYQVIEGNSVAFDVSAEDGPQFMSTKSFPMSGQRCPGWAFTLYLP